MTEAKSALRDITRWLHRNFMAVPDELLAAACNAVRWLRIDDRVKTSTQDIQQASQRDVALFHTKLAAWRGQISSELTVDAAQQRRRP